MQQKAKAGSMTGGMAIVEALIANGVDTVFGLPGAQMYPFFDALQQRSDSIRTYGARHEQGCAYMAFGYARSTGKPGVCSVVPVVVCVLNNRNLEYCTQIQRAFGGVATSTTMLDTDFAAVARAMGGNGVRITVAADLEPALRAALDADRMTVIDVVTPDSALPDGVSL